MEQSWTSVEATRSTRSGSNDKPPADDLNSVSRKRSGDEFRVTTNPLVARLKLFVGNRVRMRATGGRKSDKRGVIVTPIDRSPIDNDVTGHSGWIDTVGNRIAPIVGATNDRGASNVQIARTQTLIQTTTTNLHSSSKVGHAMENNWAMFLISRVLRIIEGIAVTVSIDKGPGVADEVQSAVNRTIAVTVGTRDRASVGHREAPHV